LFRLLLSTLAAPVSLPPIKARLLQWVILDIAHKIRHVV